MQEREDIGQSLSQNAMGDGLVAVNLTELRNTAAVPAFPCRFDVSILTRRITVDDDNVVAGACRQQREREPRNATTDDGHPHRVSIAVAARIRSRRQCDGFINALTRSRRLRTPTLSKTAFK